MWNRKFTIPKVLYFSLKYWVMVHSVLWMTRAYLKEPPRR
jgi:hypothetical protein